MNATGRVRAAVLPLALLLGAQFTALPGDAAEIASGRIYVNNTDCPPDGCRTEWTVALAADVYSEPDTGSKKLAVLAPSTKVTSLGAQQHLIPGEGRIIAKPYRTAAELDPRKIVYILKYEGEGRSRIYQNGKFYTSKIVRKRSDCEVAGQPDPRYCWVELLREPEQVETWLKIEIPGGSGTGWVVSGRGHLVRTVKD